MKWKVGIPILLALVAGGAAYAIFGGFTPLYRSDVHIIEQKTRRFWECIQFKEFGEAAAFHSAADQKKADIPKLIEKTFKVPPEQLDIKEYQVRFAEVDSTGILGRSKTRCIVELLNAKKTRKTEAVLYWKKENGRWYLKLESTLKRF